MSDDLYAVAERTQQFQLAYMAAALALVQHQYTPAYRELYRPTMDALIQKMTLPDIWESWLKSSREGTAESDPDSSDLTAGWLDPVARYNNMLKAYLLQAGALYEMLYRDGKYDKPGAFTFKYVAGTGATVQSRSVARCRTSPRSFTRNTSTTITRESCVSRTGSFRPATSLRFSAS